MYLEVRGVEIEHGYVSEELANVEDLGKLIVAKGLWKLPKVKKIANSGHIACDVQLIPTLSPKFELVINVVIAVLVLLMHKNVFKIWTKELNLLLNFWQSHSLLRWSVLEILIPIHYLLFAFNIVKQNYYKPDHSTVNDRNRSVVVVVDVVVVVVAISCRGYVASR